MNKRLTRGFKIVAIMSVASLLGACGGKSKEEVKKTENAFANLNAIFTAYNEVTAKTGKPPEGREDIAKYLPGDANPSTLFKSPNDGRPYVIIWGTDIRSAPTQGVKPLVIGYEKEGKDGERTVMTAMGVMTMTDEEFASAYFPPGHNP